MRTFILPAVAIVFAMTGAAQERQISPPHVPFGPPHVGRSMTAPAYGTEGTLDILEGGESKRVWSFDIGSATWTTMYAAPTAVGSGGSISNLYRDCDFAFVGGGSTKFFATGMRCSSPRILADTPAPIGVGAALATAGDFPDGPVDLVFALRGGDTSDFWQYSISQDKWIVLPPIPATVGDGAALVEVHSCGTLYGYHVAALRGGNTRDVWCFDIENNVWVTKQGPPPVPDALGRGASVAQLQRFGKIYVLRGGESRDFYQLDTHGTWTKLSSAPGPVSAGAGLVGINYGTQSQRDELYALQGGTSSALWRYDVATDTWLQIANLPLAFSPLPPR